MIYNKFFLIVMTISTFVKIGLVFLIFAAGMTFMTRPPPSWVREKGVESAIQHPGQKPTTIQGACKILKALEQFIVSYGFEFFPTLVEFFTYQCDKFRAGKI